MKNNLVAKILVAEDEQAIRDFVILNLNRAGYDVIATKNGKEAIEKYEENNGSFDMALLDIMMPEVDGIQVCKYLRAKDNTIGIIMLTAKTQEMDKVTGFFVGADDYITKPFSISELMARVDAVYRRVSLVKNTGTQNDAEDILQSGPFTLDVRSRTFKKNDKLIELTQIEYQIMEYFLKNANKALTRADILNHVWGTYYIGDEKIVDVNIRRLRIKIEDDPSKPVYLTTIWGLGYKWIDLC